MTILDQIVATKRAEIAEARRRRGDADVRAAAEAAPAPRNFFDALAAEGPIKLIAEIKRASPSAGLIRADFEVAEGRFGNVHLSGDFFCYPEGAIEMIEYRLKGQPVGEAGRRVLGRGPLDNAIEDGLRLQRRQRLVEVLLDVVNGGWPLEGFLAA